MALNFLRADGKDWPSPSSGAQSGGGRNATYPPAAFAYSLVMVLCLIAAHFWIGSDYVGSDNDDVMRLVEVRDLLDGQAWYEMTQYRLGLSGGTLMHWSRFIDLPIAFLIGFFRFLTTPERAEALALAVWPLLLAAVIVWLMGLAALRAGGRVAMHLASGMTMLLVYGMGRFGPGSIDHHNAQLTLAALILAMLADPVRRSRSLAIAGVGAGTSLAIGAETVPFVAAVCLAVAVLWGFNGQRLKRPVSAFSLAFVLTVTGAFFATTPPHLYGMVTCDNLSLGFYALSTIGGFLLFLAATLASGFSRAVRFAALGASAVAVLGAAVLIAPQCLRNPLAGLDPMLTELWLNKVIEARPVLDELRLQPELAGGFYATGLLALVVCLARIARRERVEQHFILAGLVAVTTGVALIQVRGAMFSNLVAIMPLSLLVAGLRAWQLSRPSSVVRSVAYLGAALASLPLVWSVAGLAAVRGTAALKMQMQTPAASGHLSCASPLALAPLAAQPAGVVMAPSDLGVHILRYTPHRVLSAPYHRNQGGMLTELNAGLSVPTETLAFLRGAEVDYVVFCPTEIQTRDIAAMKPDGFYAALLRGEVPPYLKPIAGKAGQMQLFRVQPD